MLFRMLSLFYFIGLLVVSVSVGSLYIRQYGFLVMGTGFILYSIAVGILTYLSKEK
jgi:hypothetical protein